MEQLDIEMMIYAYIQDNLDVSITAETETDYYDQYAVIRVEVRLRRPSSGEWTTISQDSDSVPNI